MSLNCTKHEETLRVTIIEVSLLSVIFIVGILLNVKTFVVILKQKRDGRRAVTIFLLNLTLISGLMALLLIPFNIYAIIERGWVFGYVFCQINGFTSVFLCTNTVFTLSCITIDRYFSVTKPFKHRIYMTRRVALRMLVIVYIGSALLAAIPIFGEAAYEYHNGTYHCSPTWQKSKAYFFLVSFLGFIFPVLGMLVTYTRIIFKVRSNRSRTGQSISASIRNDMRASTTQGPTEMSTRRVGGPRGETNPAPDPDPSTKRDSKPPEAEISSCSLQENEELATIQPQRRSIIGSVIRQMRSQARIPQEYKIARAGFILVLSFTILWAPYLTAHSRLNNSCPEGTLYSVSMLLIYLNVIANPVIYALTNRTVIRDFKSHFSRLCRRS